jgi:hypothetical protein
LNFAVRPGRAAIFLFNEIVDKRLDRIYRIDMMFCFQWNGGRPEETKKLMGVCKKDKLQRDKEGRETILLKII